MAKVVINMEANDDICNYIKRNKLKHARIYRGFLAHVKSIGKLEALKEFNSKGCVLNNLKEENYFLKEKLKEVEDGDVAEDEE